MIKAFENRSDVPPIGCYSDERLRASVNEIIPPYVPEIGIAAKVKRSLLMLFSFSKIMSLLIITGVVAFIGYRGLKNTDTFLHNLIKNKTIAITLTDQKQLQSVEIDDTLARLETPDTNIYEKLVDITVAGYADDGLSRDALVIYDQGVRDESREVFERYISRAIDHAYRIYENFTPQTEREVYGITSEELVYQIGLRVPGYKPMALKNSLFESRRYFPFALIAGQLANIDPIRLLKIFEIETNFNEASVGRNSNRIVNDDIGIAQNNLVIIPGLIGDMLNSSSPVYNPYLEFFALGIDLETGKQLTWQNFLIRLEGELKGSYDEIKNPTGKYYINLLKAPHIGAILAAYHIKRDETYRLFSRCMNFYTQNAKELKQELKLDVELDPYHWTDYTFYNGGPKRWYLMRNYLRNLESGKPIHKNLRLAVKFTTRRNIVAQRIGTKNEKIRSVIYDSSSGQLVENNGILPNGLYDFAMTFEERTSLYKMYSIGKVNKKSDNS